GRFHRIRSVPVSERELFFPFDFSHASATWGTVVFASTLFGVRRLNAGYWLHGRRELERKKEGSHENPGDTADADSCSFVRDGAGSVVGRFRVVPCKEHWPICLSQ